MISKAILSFLITFQVLCILFTIQGCSNIEYVNTNKELFNHVKIEEYKPTEAKTISDINKNYLELYRCYIKNKNILETLRTGGCKK